VKRRLLLGSSKDPLSCVTGLRVVAGAAVVIILTAATGCESGSGSGQQPLTNASATIEVTASASAPATTNLPPATATPVERAQSPASADPYPAATQAGATAVCADGSWSYSAHRSGTCSHHGGVHWWTGKLGPAGPGDH
jgi:hypothetical protein